MVLIQRLLSSAISGLFLWSGFAPLNFWLGPIIGLAILFRNLVGCDYRNSLFVALTSGFAFFGPLLYWTGTYVGAVPWLLLATLETALFSLIFLAPKNPLGFAATFTVIELVRMKFPFGGFGWGRIGFTQTEILAPWYPIVGVTGISLCVAIIAASLSYQTVRRSLISLAIVGLPFLLPASNSVGRFSVTAVQGGVDQLGLDFNSRAMAVFNRHLVATEKGIADSDLVIWPENAVDVDPWRNSKVRSSLNNLSREINAPLLIGAVQQGELGPENVSILYDENGEVLSRYQKQDLAPFGEYIPIRKIAELVSPEAKSVRDFSPGREWITHKVGGYEFISPICFEVLDDDLLKSGAKGVDFLVAQTNNATFGKSAQAAQQMQIIKARAAELHRDFAVVSTTGFTAHVNANGETVEVLPQFAAGELQMELDVFQDQTLASKVHSWHWAVGLGLLISYSRGKKNR